MTRCGALITREFKRAKADSRYPTEPFTNPDMLPICGGQVTFKVKVYQGCPNCHGDGNLDVIADCSRCKHPYFGRDLVLQMQLDPASFVEQVLNSGLTNDYATLDGA